MLTYHSSASILYTRVRNNSNEIYVNLYRDVSLIARLFAKVANASFFPQLEVLQEFIHGQWNPCHLYFLLCLIFVYNPLPRKGASMPL